MRLALPGHGELLHRVPAGSELCLCTAGRGAVPPCLRGPGARGCARHSSFSHFPPRGTLFPHPQGSEGGMSPDKHCPGKPRELGEGSPFLHRPLGPASMSPEPPVVLLSVLVMAEFLFVSRCLISSSAGMEALGGRGFRLFTH